MIKEVTGMDQELINPQSSSISSSRIIYTPSTFARTSLLHLQEVGLLRATHPHTGAKVLGDIDLGNFTTIGANAVVNKSEEGNCLLIGIPAEKKRYEDAWMKGSYRERYEACEKLRQTMFNSL